MPKGPRGEKRPGDVVGTAIMVGRIAAFAALAFLAPGTAVAHTSTFCG
jgi:hypothetical protein